LRPYLKHSSEQELAERLRYIVENMTVLTREGKAGVLAPEPHGKHWYPLFEHALEEYRQRNLPPPANFLKNAQVPDPSHSISAQALAAVRRASLAPDETYLVKLGKRDHMSAFYRDGKLRIAPAGIYNDPSLNAAICDDELSLSSFGLQSEVLIEAFDPKTGTRKFASDPIGNVTYTSRSKTDYYVFCMATLLDARLFGDFGYDSCVVIRDSAQFERRLSEAVAQRLPGLDWRRGGCAIRRSV
jgi:hypothetical protein